MAKCVQCQDRKQSRAGSLCYPCFRAKWKDNPGPGIDDEAGLMAWVMEGAPCTTEVQKAFKADFNKSPRAFLQRYKELTGTAQATLPNGNVVTAEETLATMQKKLVRDGETPCPLCKQIVYPEDKGTARLLAETQLKNIPNVIKERPVLLARIAELEKENKELQEEFDLTH